MNSSSTMETAVQTQTDSQYPSTGNPAGEVFTYRPLDITQGPCRTRFLTLLPAKSLKDEIHCTIEDGSLGTSPEERPHLVYEALSYTWGKSKDSRYIFLSYKQDDNHRVMLKTSGETKAQADPGSEARLEIQPNLEVALRHIRLTDTPRILWIDAICINQKDEGEINCQLEYMRDIYLKAQRVLAWLGEEEDAMEALKFLNKMSWTAPDCSNYVFSVNDAAKWRACDKLFKREYWTRSWTQQEVLHPKEVTFRIGMEEVSIDNMSASFDMYFYTKLNWASERDSIALNKYKSENSPEPSDSRYDASFRATAISQSAPGILHTTLRQLEASESLSKRGDGHYDGWFQATAISQSAPDSLFTMRKQLKNSGDALRLSKLLYMYRNQKAEKPKDKIYSMYCMAKSEYKIPIVYKTRENGGCSDGDIFNITTRKMLTRVLLVLLWVESPDREIASSKDNNTLPSWVPDYNTKQGLTARTLITTYDYFSANKGFPGGMSSKNTDDSSLNPSPLFVVRGVYVACITSTHYTYVTGDWIKTDDFVDYHRLKMIQYDRNPALRISTAEGKGDARPKTNASTPALDISFENTSWGPCKAEKGDIIIVAAGCKIPLVLRKHGEEYLFVGGCWLVDKKIKDLRKLQVRDDAFSGVMYGDAVKEIENGSVVEEFILC